MAAWALPLPRGEIQPGDSTVAHTGASSFQPRGLDTQVNINSRRNQTALHSPQPAGERKVSAPLKTERLSAARGVSPQKTQEGPRGAEGAPSAPVRVPGASTAPQSPHPAAGAGPTTGADSGEGSVQAALGTSCSLCCAVTSDNFFHTIISSDHNRQSLRKNS